MYEATDLSGNTARRQRLVYVVDSCNATNEFRWVPGWDSAKVTGGSPLLSLGSRVQNAIHHLQTCRVTRACICRCPKTLKCSVFRSCNITLSTSSNSASSIASTTTTQVVLERPPDTIPPIITVTASRPTDLRYVTSSGGRGVITYVYVDDAYVDAGATAMDEIPSAGGAPSSFVPLKPYVSSILDPSGEVVEEIATSAPTGNETTGLPYLVSYDVADDAGLRAPTARRRVYVLCKVRSC